MNMNTQLNDRTVWFDGSISIDPSTIDKFISYDRVFVTSLNDEIIQYNKLMPLSDRLGIKDSNTSIPTEWNIPNEFKDIDASLFICEAFLIELDQFGEMTNEEHQSRCDRIQMELDLFKTHKLMPLLRTLIFIINTFEKRSVVWGPGRGSSVSSYILYLIKVHDVDSVLYGLDITDFIK